MLCKQSLFVWNVHKIKLSKCPENKISYCVYILSIYFEKRAIILWKFTSVFKVYLLTKQEWFTNVVWQAVVEIMIQNAKSKYFVYHTKSTLKNKSKWREAIPGDNIPDTPNTFIFEDHWPKGYETKCVYGKLRPLNPPSVFTSCIKPSLVPTQLARPRPTKWALSSVRNTQPDDNEVFIQNYWNASYRELKEKLKDITEPFLVTMQLQNLLRKLGYRNSC